MLAVEAAAFLLLLWQKKKEKRKSNVSVGDKIFTTQSPDFPPPLFMIKKREMLNIQREACSDNRPLYRAALLLVHL